MVDIRKLVPLTHPYIYLFKGDITHVSDTNDNYWKIKLDNGEIYIAFTFEIDTSIYPDYVLYGIQK
jgi:hypothetical protein